MLIERRVTSLRIDPITALVTVEAQGALPTGESLPAQVLLRADGTFVGLDLEPDSSRRLLLMKGEHEEVAQVVPVTVASDGRVATFRPVKGLTIR